MPNKRSTSPKNNQTVKKGGTPLYSAFARRDNEILSSEIKMRRRCCARNPAFPNSIFFIIVNGRQPTNRENHRHLVPAKKKARTRSTMGGLQVAATTITTTVIYTLTRINIVQGWEGGRGGYNLKPFDHLGTPQVLIRSPSVYFAGEALLAESRAEFCRSSLPPTMSFDRPSTGSLISGIEAALCRRLRMTRDNGLVKRRCPSIPFFVHFERVNRARGVSRRFQLELCT